MIGSGNCCTLVRPVTVLSFFLVLVLGSTTFAMGAGIYG